MNSAENKEPIKTGEQSSGANNSGIISGTVNGNSQLISNILNTPEKERLVKKYKKHVLNLERIIEDFNGLIKELKKDEETKYEQDKLTAVQLDILENRIERYELLWSEIERTLIKILKTFSFDEFISISKNKLSFYERNEFGFYTLSHFTFDVVRHETGDSEGKKIIKDKIRAIVGNIPDSEVKALQEEE